MRLIRGIIKSSTRKGSIRGKSRRSGKASEIEHQVGRWDYPVPTNAGYTPLILIVDDELAARELLTSYLTPTYRVETADSGAEALAKATELRPDAVILDVLMGKGNGFETLVALRNATSTASIPVIILSIVDQKQVGFALGASDYLIKPIRKPLLLDTVRKYVSSQTIDDSTILLVDDDPRTWN